MIIFKCHVYSVSPCVHCLLVLSGELSDFFVSICLYLCWACILLDAFFISTVLASSAENFPALAEPSPAVRLALKVTEIWKHSHTCVKQITSEQWPPPTLPTHTPIRDATRSVWYGSSGGVGMQLSKRSDGCCLGGWGIRGHSTLGSKCSKLRCNILHCTGFFSGKYFWNWIHVCDFITEQQQQLTAFTIRYVHVGGNIDIH